MNLFEIFLSIFLSRKRNFCQLPRKRRLHRQNLQESEVIPFRNFRNYFCHLYRAL